MFGASSQIVYFYVNFTLLSREVGFHFLFEKVSRFHISYIVWDITPDFALTYEKLFFEISNRGWGICRSFILRVSYFEILVLLVIFPLRFSGHISLRILCTRTQTLTMIAKN